MKVFILILMLGFFSLGSNAQSYHYQSGQAQEQKKITITNKNYYAKELQIYVKNSSYKWEFLQTIRIPGGESISFAIGRNESHYSYGYLESNSYRSTIASFSSYPLTLY